ncbi:aspartate aminotransferase family protein [Gottfriedia sp. NPDC056225]|uniref:aspartate aminotransferase family protein n=1 Tax=Gottfriedia sp. NPDC056225 TaxID=3345751 RepID=UPI0015595402|nr:aspartate aminotransferase family protein [Arthrobacter citreus]
MTKRDYLIKPLVGENYPIIDRGETIYLWDKQGKKYIDGSSGAVAASIGHGVKEIVDEMVKQANKVAFVYRSQFTSEAAELLAEKIGQLTPGDLNWSFFVNSGTEATETAMKMAIQHFQEKGIQTKTKIISRSMSYHGITMGALSMSGHPLRRKRFTSLLADYPMVEAPYCKRCPYELEPGKCGLLCATSLERSIQKLGSENVAAFIAEPIVGAAGAALTPPKGYYEKIKEICEKHDVLFIADEVMTGIGRTGEMFGINHWECVPDLLVLGKGLAAGYTPIAVAIASDRVMQPILEGSRLVMSGHTFSANPLSANIALAVLNYVEKNGLVQNSKVQGEKIKLKLKEWQKIYPFLFDIRGEGLLIGIEINEEFFNCKSVTNRVIEIAKDKGLLLYPSVSGPYGRSENSFLLSPPLVITDAQVDELLTLLMDVFIELNKEAKGTK